MAGLIDYASSVAGEAKKNVQGLLADPKQALKDILNNLALKAAAQQAATKAAWATRDPKIMAKNALDSSQTALGFAPLGITAWHGSPHKFNKFRTDKIGTGEGAQAYGHGLYLAESPEVAKSYRDNLTSGLSVKGYDSEAPQEYAARLVKQWGSPEKAMRILDNAGERLPTGRRLEFYNAIKDGSYKQSHEMLPEGSLYKADIPDEAVARFLDWDKPLSQQAPEVIEAIKKSSAKYGPVRGNSPIYSDAAAPYMTGQDFYRDIATALSDGGVRSGSTALSGQDAIGSQHLRELGIPGIRYLDEGSRNTTQRYIAKHPMGGESVFNTQPELDAFIKRNPVFKAINPNLTSNYVAFDPEMIRILERNGQSTGAVPWQPGEWRGLLGNN